jgi:hypothetical protein
MYRNTDGNSRTNAEGDQASSHRSLMRRPSRLFSQKFVAVKREG